MKNAWPVCDNWTDYPYLAVRARAVWTSLNRIAYELWPVDDDVIRMPSIPERVCTRARDGDGLIYPSISQGDGELDLHEAETGLREIILRRVSSRADGDDDGAG